MGKGGRNFGVMSEESREHNTQLAAYLKMQEDYKKLHSPNVSLEEKKKIIGYFKNYLSDESRLPYMRFFEEQNGKIGNLNLSSPDDLKESLNKIYKIGSEFGDVTSKLELAKNYDRYTDDVWKAADIYKSIVENKEGTVSERNEAKTKLEGLVDNLLTRGAPAKPNAFEKVKDILKTVVSKKYGSDEQIEKAQQILKQNAPAKEEETKDLKLPSQLQKDSDKKTQLKMGLGTKGELKNTSKTEPEVKKEEDFDSQISQIISQLSKVSSAYVQKKITPKEYSDKASILTTQIEDLKTKKAQAEEKEIEGLSPEEINTLGNEYFLGQKGKAKDLKKAAELYGIARKNGDKNGSYNLASAYLKGDGVEKDEEFAKELFQEAYNRGFTAKHLNPEKYPSHKVFLDAWNKATEPLKKAEEEKAKQAALKPTPSVKERVNDIETKMRNEANQNPQKNVSFANQPQPQGVKPAETAPAAEPVDVQHYVNNLPDTASSIGDTSNYTEEWDKPAEKANVELPKATIGTDVPHEVPDQGEGEDWNLYFKRAVGNILLDKLKDDSGVSPFVEIAPLEDEELKAMEQVKNHIANRHQGKEEAIRSKAYKSLQKDVPGQRASSKLMDKATRDFDPDELKRFYNPYDKEVIQEMRKDFEDRLEKRMNQISSSFVGKHMSPQMRNKAMNELRKEDEREWARHKTTMLRDSVDKAYERYFADKKNALEGGQALAQISQNDRNLAHRNLADWRAESQASEDARHRNIASMMAVGEKKRGYNENTLKNVGDKERLAQAKREAKLTQLANFATGNHVPMMNPYIPQAPTPVGTAPSAYTNIASLAPQMMQMYNAQQQQNMMREQHNAQMNYYKNNPGVNPGRAGHAAGGSVSDYAMDNLKRQMFDQQNILSNYHANMATSANPVIDGLAAFGQGMLSRPEGSVGFGSIGPSMQAATQAMQASQGQAAAHYSQSIALKTAMYNTLRVEEKEKQEQAMKREAMDLKRAGLSEQAAHHRAMEDIQRQELDMKRQASRPISREEKFRSSQEESEVKAVIQQGIEAQKAYQALQRAKQVRKQEGRAIFDNKPFHDALAGIPSKYIEKKGSSSFNPSTDIKRLDLAAERAKEDIAKAEFYKEFYLSKGLPLEEVNALWDQYSLEGKTQKKNLMPPEANAEAPIQLDEGITPEAGAETQEESYLDKGVNFLKKLPGQAADLAKGLARDVIDRPASIIGSLAMGEDPRKITDEDLEKKYGLASKIFDVTSGGALEKPKGKTSPGIVDVAESGAKAAVAIPDIFTGGEIGKGISEARKKYVGKTSEDNIVSDLAGEIPGSMVGGGALGKLARSAGGLLKSAAPFAGKAIEGLGKFFQSGTAFNKENIGRTAAALGTFETLNEVTDDPLIAVAGSLIVPGVGESVINKFNKLSPELKKQALEESLKGIRGEKIKELMDEGFEVLKSHVPYQSEGGGLYNQVKDRFTGFIEKMADQAWFKNTVHKTAEKNFEKVIGEKNLNIDKLKGKSSQAGSEIQDAYKVYMQGLKDESEKLIKNTEKLIKPVKENGVSVKTADKVLKEFNVPENVIKSLYKDGKIESLFIPENMASALKGTSSEVRNFVFTKSKDFLNTIKENDPKKIFKEADGLLKELNKEIYVKTTKPDVAFINKIKDVKAAFEKDLDKFFGMQPKQVKENYEKYKNLWFEHFKSIPMDASGKLPASVSSLGQKASPEMFSESLEKAFESNKPLFDFFATKATPKQIKPFVDNFIYKLGEKDGAVYLPKVAEQYKSLPVEMKERLSEMFKKTNPKSASLDRIMEVIEIIKPKLQDQSAANKKVKIDRMTPGAWMIAFNFIGEVFGTVAGSALKMSDSKINEIIKALENISRSSASQNINKAVNKPDREDEED